MKKTITVLLIILSMLFVGCDNNSGPFTKEYRNGDLILLSAGKPAKGDVSWTYQGYNMSIPTYTAHYIDGVIHGKCEIYNDKNVVVFEGEFIRKDTNTYDVNVKLYNGTIKGTINTSSEELEILFEEPVLRGFRENVNLDNWFDRRAIDATIDTDNFKATKINGVYDGKVERENTISIYKDGVLLESTNTNYNGGVLKTYYRTNEITETYFYDKDNILKSYMYNDASYYSYSIREKYTTDRYTKFISAEDKGSIAYQGITNNDEIEISIVLDDSYPSITVRGPNRNIIEYWALPAGYHMDMEQLKSIYYEIIGSNLAKYPGELKKLLSDPNIVLIKYHDIYGRKHYISSDNQRIDELGIAQAQERANIKPYTLGDLDGYSSLQLLKLYRKNGLYVIKTRCDSDFVLLESVHTRGRDCLNEAIANNGVRDIWIHQFDDYEKTDKIHRGLLFHSEEEVDAYLQNNGFNLIGAY